MTSLDRLTLRRFTNVPALAGLAFLASVTGASAQDSAAFRRIVDSAVAAGMPGLQACVRRAAVQWCGAAGLASVESRQPMTNAHRIRIASITKPMTYASTMRLVEAGRLRLTDRAVDRLPSRTLDGIPHASEITIGQLLDHTSGLHNYNGERGADFFESLLADSRRGTRIWTPAKLIAFARKPSNPPTGLPGERRSYSSTGYSVLELILEHTTGRPIATIFREHIFRPLGMPSAGIEGKDFGADSIADSYGRPGSGGGIVSDLPFRGRDTVRPDGLVNLSRGLKHFAAWAGAGGSVAVNAGDLARFIDAIVAGQRVVLADQRAEFERAAAMPNVTLSWNGGSWGIQASALVEPGRNIAVVVLGNATNVGVETYPLAVQLMRAARTP